MFGPGPALPSDTLNYTQKINSTSMYNIMCGGGGATGDMYVSHVYFKVLTHTNATAFIHLESIL